MNRLILALGTLAVLGGAVEGADVDSRVSTDHSSFLNERPGSVGIAWHQTADHIVVYSATWCMPCQRLKPVLGSLEKQSYNVIHRDIDRDTAELQFEYHAVPTIYFVRNNVVIKTETGYQSMEKIKQTLMPDSRREPDKPSIGWN